MNASIKMIAVGSLCALTAAPALAQSADQIAAKFTAADKNHDGKLTLDEAKNGMPRVAKNFSKIDAGRKGYVTLQDIMTMYQKSR